MRGRAWQEAGTGGAKAGSQERESSLGSLHCREEGAEEGERRGWSGRQGQASLRPLGHGGHGRELGAR